MKEVKFELKELKRIVKQLQAIIKGSSSILEITGYTKINISKGVSEFTVMDSGTHLAITLDCESPDNFVVVVPVNDLASIIATSNKGDVILNFNPEDEKKKNAIKITTDLGSAYIPIADNDDFLTPPETKSLISFDITKDMLDKASIAAQFVSTDTLRPAMTGVNFHLKKDKLLFVATDAHRLYMTSEIDVEPKNSGEPCEELQLIVPYSTIKHLAYLDLPDTINLSFESNDKITISHLQVKTTQYCYVVRLIDAKYPDYRAVVPECDYFYKVEKNSITNALKFVSSCANETTRQVILNLGSENDITITADNADEDKSATSSIPVIENNGEELKQAFNSKLLMDALAIQNDEIIIKHSGSPTRAVLIQSNNNEDTVLLMPLMIGV